MASITASTWDRSPRSQRATPRARVLFPRSPAPPWCGRVQPGAFVLAAQALDRGCLRALLRLATLRGQGVERADLPGSAPLHDVGGVQPLPSQQGAPLAPGSSRRSYCSRIASLYSAVKARRRGRAAGSLSATTPSWTRVAKGVDVMVMGLGGPVSPCSVDSLRQVSQGEPDRQGRAATVVMMKPRQRRRCADGRRARFPSYSVARENRSNLSPPGGDVEGWTAGSSEQVDAQVLSNVCLMPVVRTSRMTEARLHSLYEAEGLGGERTMRAKVIRELIDEIRVLRRELAQAEGRESVSRPEV